MSLITISDLTTSESFISEISEIETGTLLGGYKIKIKGSFNTVVANSSIATGKDSTALVGAASGNSDNTLALPSS